MKGTPVNFDFKIVAGAKGDEWGEVTETFIATPGYVLFTGVVTYPLGCVIEEAQNGEAIAFTEVNDGGGKAAGIEVGDVIRACTALTVPPSANLVTEPVGALFQTNPMNPNLFDQTMEAVSSNAVANGGTGKAIIVIERSATA